MSKSVRILKSSVQLSQPLSWLGEQLGPEATVVVEFNDKVIVRRLEELIALEDAQHIRAFNDQCECVITREANRYVGHSVRETAHDGEECNVRDGINLCYGKSENTSHGTVTFGENRIKSYAIPEGCLSGGGRSGQLYVHYREYIACDDDGAAYVTGHRVTCLSINDFTTKAN